MSAEPLDKLSFLLSGWEVRSSLLDVLDMWDGGLAGLVRYCDEQDQQDAYLEATLAVNEMRFL
jgi:hypothetical protein